jgi:hypothetical protein
MDILLILFTHHDAFDLISLEGVSICLCKTQLVDNFGGTNLAWASMGLEAHRLDTMAHIQMMNTCLWIPRRHHGGPKLSPTPNDLPKKAKTSPLRA